MPPSLVRISFIIADVKVQKRVRVHPKQSYSDIALSCDVFDSCRRNQQSWRASGCAHASSLHRVTSNKTTLDFCSVEWKQATSQHLAICFCQGEHIQTELQAQMWRLWHQWDGSEVVDDSNRRTGVLNSEVLHISHFNTKITKRPMKQSCH